MKRAALALGLALALPCAALAQPPTTSPAPAASTGPIVLVFDAGGSRISAERVRRSLAATLHRSVLRMTDTGATAAPTTLTLAFQPPHDWVLDVTRDGRRATRRVTLRAATIASLTRLAATLVSELDPAPPAPTTRRGDWIALIGDEIIDPFSGQPPAVYRRRSRGFEGELVDPFSTTGRQRGYDDVIDPWSR
jgi:hypothetical protein